MLQYINTIAILSHLTGTGSDKLKKHWLSWISEEAAVASGGHWVASQLQGTVKLCGNVGIVYSRYMAMQLGWIEPTQI